jgi:hypothetical protein
MFMPLWLVIILAIILVPIIYLGLMAIFFIIEMMKNNPFG